MKSYKLLLTGTGMLALALFAQGQSYPGSNETGLLTLSGTVNLMELATADAASNAQSQGALRLLRELGGVPLKTSPSAEFPKHLPKRIEAPLFRTFGAQSLRPMLGGQAATPASPVSLAIVNGGGFDFNGLTQLDQRDANGGNQFTVEPPNPSVAVAGGYVLEGVNNAVQIYDTRGNALLPAVLATNEVFGLPPALNRTTGDYGPFPTDMRVFYDSDIERWMILQRAQDEDAFGDNLATSHLYLAVSQTTDPTAVYNVYIADTTDLTNSNCPCTDDYPQIGADRYGFYISANQFNSDSETFVDTTILGVSKADLGTGAATPTAFGFVLPLETGYEFAVQPASTPPGASPFLANGGVEYFSSTVSGSEAGDTVAVWSLSNTSSLATKSPQLTLSQVAVQTLSYQMPEIAAQPNGPLSYNSVLPVLDGGDTRVLSLTYAGARLYLTLATGVSDQSGNQVVGGALIVLSPTIRGGVLRAAVLNENYLFVNGQNLLRPSVAVGPQGVGAISATLVGPDWYPSAAFIPVSALATPSTLYVAGVGTAPEDGFTAADDGGIARWGDYSTAVAASDGSIWTATEYIGSLPRTAGANWDTLVTQVKP